MKTIAIVAIAVVVIIGIIIGALYAAFIGGFNTVQTKDEHVKKLAADVDTQLQRRYDLIPNLVQSVKGYMQFEKDTLEEVTRLRSQWQTSSGADRVTTSNQLEQTLSKLLLTYEQYPELKSDQTVTRLMDELAGTENRIAVARSYYNDGVRDFNTNLRTFPNNAFNESGFLGMSPWNMKPYPIYETIDAARSAPQVDLQLNK